ncbi:MAG: protein disulfide oxidoreductase [Sulfurimonas sp.]|nr:protein disulfide oxidoreductase [Sulfurimonas sp.]MDQ7062424.1 protein disulfide oxidoreductase [Sulfurimonas sp.]
MTNKVKHYIKEILVFALVIIIFANAMSLYKSLDLSKEPLPLTNISLLNNNKYIISNSEPTLVHFWAIWCPTCKVEASNIQSISENYNVLTIAVKSGTNEDIQKWLKENDYNFNVVNDKNGLLSSNFKIGAFPTTFIYDKNKNLVFSDVGYTSTWGLMLRMWWASL